MQKRAQKINRPVLLVSVASALALAAHIYLNLGDYTAERGMTAFVQTAAVAAAFGAMVFLIAETARTALAKAFPDE